MRKRVTLDSSAIAAVTYDSERFTLDVQFREGEAYRYFAVPQFVFEALLAAGSAGAFWNRVKDNYRHKRLD
ncbi:MAG TPA: KTSC domain-containing protein [Chthoniobacterales bacterium]|jgi:lysyl-tRNA synthetase class 2